MADPIEAHYTPDGDDWTVAVTGRGKTLTGRAPGLIAARDRADQLVEQLAPEEAGHKTVVHMLNGDAVEFTTAYLTARLARTEEPPLEVPAPGSTTETEPPTATKPESPAANETERPAGTETERPAGAGDEPSAGGEPAATERTAATEDKAAGVPTAAKSEAGVPAHAKSETGVPAPVKSEEGGKPAEVKPTPAPRTGSEAARPAAQPTTAETPETASSNS